MYYDEERAKKVTGGKDCRDVVGKLAEYSKREEAAKIRGSKYKNKRAAAVASEKAVNKPVVDLSRQDDDFFESLDYPSSCPDDCSSSYDNYSHSGRYDFLTANIADKTYKPPQTTTPSIADVPAKSFDDIEELLKKILTERGLTTVSDNLNATNSNASEKNIRSGKKAVEKRKQTNSGKSIYDFIQFETCNFNRDFSIHMVRQRWSRNRG